MPELAVGADLPWLDYGQAFGASAWRPQGGVAQPDRRTIRADFGELVACFRSELVEQPLSVGLAGVRALSLATDDATDGPAGSAALRAWSRRKRPEP